jgi:hypothetical protein
MNRQGQVRFERDAGGQLTFCLLVQGVEVARSAHALSIAADVALRDLDALDLGGALTVRVPTSAACLLLADARGGIDAPAARALIAACAW